jgi:hypothetical protein
MKKNLLNKTGEKSRRRTSSVASGEPIKRPKANEPYVRAMAGKRMEWNEKLEWKKARYGDRKPGFSAYAMAILESVPDCLIEDCEQIEEVMRTQHSTLDHLTFKEFLKLAQGAWLAVKQLRDEGVYERPKYGGD